MDFIHPRLGSESHCLSEHIWEGEFTFIGIFVDFFDIKFLFKFLNKNILNTFAMHIKIYAFYSLNLVQFIIFFSYWLPYLSNFVFCISTARKVLANNLTPSTFFSSLPSSIRNEFSSSFHIFLGVFFHFFFARIAQYTFCIQCRKSLFPV